MGSTGSLGPTPAGRDWDVGRLSPALGAEVRGVRLETATAADAERIHRLLIEHHVLFFPDQDDLTIDGHVRFGGFFGEVAERHPHLKNPFTDHPKIFELAASRGGIADEWHTDLTFQPQPALLSILRMVTCPDIGGDTIWANTADAFDALSEPMQDFLSGLTALHDALPHGRPEKMTIHPVIREHPETGRKVLYVSPHFTRRIVELSHFESEALLRHLFSVIQQHRFTVRYRWAPNTVGMWDNRCTQHSVMNDFDGERIIQRVTVLGDEPKGEPARWRPWPEARERGDLTRHDRQLIGYLRGDEPPGGVR